MRIKVIFVNMINMYSLYIIPYIIYQYLIEFIQKACIIFSAHCQGKGQIITAQNIMNYITFYSELSGVMVDKGVHG
jgi:hypothetical protein